MFSRNEMKISVIIKTDGADSKQASDNPTSWSKIFFFFCPSDGFLNRRMMILAATAILKIIDNFYNDSSK